MFTIIQSQLFIRFNHRTYVFEPHDHHDCVCFCAVQRSTTGVCCKPVNWCPHDGAESYQSCRSGVCPGAHCCSFVEPSFQCGRGEWSFVTMMRVPCGGNVCRAQLTVCRNPPDSGSLLVLVLFGSGVQIPLRLNFFLQTQRALQSVFSERFGVCC
jgi:hypothetical protein